MRRVAILLVLVVPCLTAVAQNAVHGREFWRSIANNKYAVPEGQSQVALMRELSGYLGSPDPVLRDDLAYNVLTSWIIDGQLPAEDLNSFADEWTANLRRSQDQADGVLLRSFSALCLVALADRDLKHPFLGEKRYRHMLDEGLAYLTAEKDVRGFDPKLGWIHAAAHTADLLTELSANPMFRTEDQGQVLDAIAGRLASAHEIFTFGEQDRLALTVATIAKRKDFDTEGFRKWLAALDASDQKVWNDMPPKVELLQTFENNTYMLRGVAAFLSQVTDGTAAEAKSAVLKSLERR